MGRVAALWVLSFGGTIPVANLIAGPVVERTSLTVRDAGRCRNGGGRCWLIGVRLTAGAVVGEEILGTSQAR